MFKFVCILFELIYNICHKFIIIQQWSRDVRSFLEGVILFLCVPDQFYSH